MASSSIISSRGLSKHFRSSNGAPVVAVEDLTMDVEAGTVTALLGPNGAGKSTSLRMLTTLLEPNGGQASVCGFDVSKQPHEVRRRIGYIGQKNGAAHYQRLRDELLSQGAFYGLGRHESRRRADELIEILQLEGLTDRPVIQLSGGQRRRVDIALGLMPGPRLLFLDEPSTGLDPQSRVNLWEHLLTLRQRYEMTLLLTTHYLEEADRYAKRVLIVDQGRVIADDTAAQLKTDFAGDRITLTMTGHEGMPGAMDDENVRRILSETSMTSGHTEARVLALAEGRFVVTVEHGDHVLPRLLSKLETAGYHVLSAELDRPSLDDVFLNLTGRNLRDDGQGEEPTGPSPDAVRVSETRFPVDTIGVRS